MYTITTRSPNADEQQLIASRATPDIASFVYIIIFFAIVPVWLLGILGGWVGDFISVNASTYGRWIGWLVSAILFISMLATFIPYERRKRLRASQDSKRQIIQDIHIFQPRLVEIARINDNEPILAFQIDENQILYLQGQWIRDEGMYGAEPLKCDPYGEFINGLPEPYSFPSTEFKVSRFPNSKEVTGIHVTGKYLAPETEVTAVNAEYEFGDSELFDGSLDDIAGVLAQEHERRKAR